MSALLLENVTAGYGARAAVHHVSFEAAPGSLVALVGPNGGGKTTLLRAIAGELALLGGRIEPVAHGRRRLAYMPQVGLLDRSFPIDVEGIVTGGLWAGCALFGAPGPRGRARVREAIAAVGLEGFERRQLYTLSGGQLQRALFARAMAQDAEIVLLDEPFAAVDAQTASRLMDIMARWAGRGRIVLAVVHDLALARERFPTAALIARELIAFGPAQATLSPENLSRARRLSEAWREDAPICAAPVG